MLKQTCVSCALAALALVPVMPAHAQGVVQRVAPPSGVLSLEAQASAEVAQDTVQITLFYEQQASDPAALTATLNERTDEALRKAKTQHEVRIYTGTFSVFPSTDASRQITGWRGRTELILESRDFAAASRLAGQLAPRLQVGDVRFSLSPEAQRNAQNRLAGEAIAAFRRQAQAAVQAFGYSGYTIREVSLGHNGPSMPRPVMMAARSAMADGKIAAVPLEAGQANVTVSVSGSVQMSR